MKRRTMGLGMLAGLTLLVSGVVSGCSGGDSGGKEREMGELALSLSSRGASDIEYRLRDAVFEIRREGYYDDYNEAGAGTSPEVITVSSEDDPEATSIRVSVERGYHYVTLLPGWHLEKIDGGGPVVVEAQLLSSATQWVYVQPHSSSWVEYQFGLGDREVWFNGDLNIGIHVYEDPSELYGGEGGAGGDGGIGGGTSVGGSPGAGGA